MTNIDEIIRLVHLKLGVNDNRVDNIKRYSKGQSAVINYNSYKYVYVLSDIHADFNSLFITLLQNNIIGLFQNGTKIEEAEKLRIMTDIITNYNVKEPNTQDPRLFPFGKSKVDILKNIMTRYDIKLIKSNTLILILGDVVDGRRTRSNDPNDSDSHIFEDVTNMYGLNELLIHILFYNMRIDGQQMNSNVIIVLGNHEIMTLFDTTNEYVYANYVDLQTHKLFRNQENRRKILVPFYLFDSAFFKIIVRNNKIISYASHGSFGGLDKLDKDEYKNYTIRQYDGIFSKCRDYIIKSYETGFRVESFDTKQSLTQYIKSERDSEKKK